MLAPSKFITPFPPFVHAIPGEASTVFAIVLDPQDNIRV